MKLLRSRTSGGKTRRLTCEVLETLFLFTDASFEKKWSSWLDAVLLNGTGKVLTWFGMCLSQEQLAPFSQCRTANNYRWTWDLGSCLVTTGLAEPPGVGATYGLHRQRWCKILTDKGLLHLQSNNSFVRMGGDDTRYTFLCYHVCTGAFNFQHSRLPLKTAWASSLGERHHDSHEEIGRSFEESLSFLKVALMPPWDMGGDRGESGIAMFPSV